MLTDAEKRMMWLGRVEHWLLGHTWLHEDTLMPGSATDGGTLGTVFCARCGVRSYDWRLLV